MGERDTVQTRGGGIPRLATGTLAIVGGSLFISGLFVLAAAGHAYPCSRTCSSWRAPWR